ncbi:MAG: hypothetical protein MHM6MM_004255, partial [Cercozoa sp. M6MM]
MSSLPSAHDELVEQLSHVEPYAEREEPNAVTESDTAGISAQIVGTLTNQDEGGSFLEYRISVTMRPPRNSETARRGDLTWLVFRRYSAFVQLWRELRTEVSEDLRPAVPDLPRRHPPLSSTLLRLTASPRAKRTQERFLARRETMLREFLAAVAAHPALSNSAAFLRFVGVVKGAVCYSTLFYPP